MRTLVTGASGFVGRHVADALRDRGGEVRCLVRKDADAAQLAAAGFDVVRGDLSDAARLAAAVDGCDAVVHVAGMIAARSLREMRDVNEGGTGRLAAACGRVASPPRRFVLVSSLAAVGPSAPGRPVREDDAPHPVSRYGWTKLLGERAARRALAAATTRTAVTSQTAVTSLTVIRPPAVFGPRDRGIHAFFKAASLGIRPQIGLRPRAISMVYGPDLAAAIVAAAASERAAGRTYHVADPEEVDVTRALGWIADAVGRPTLRVVLPEALVRTVGFVAEEIARLRGRTPEFSRDKANEFLASGWACDTSRARDELGWAPSRPLRQAFAETAAWYRAEGWIK